MPLALPAELDDGESLPLPLSVGVRLGDDESFAVDAPGCEDGGELGSVTAVPILCRTAGLGKLDFLSMASTVRWKRRKRASARTSVESRSIVLESSLTHDCQLERSGM